MKISQKSTLENIYVGFILQCVEVVVSYSETLGLDNPESRDSEIRLTQFLFV